MAPALSPPLRARGRVVTALWWLAGLAAVGYLIAMVVTGALPRQRQLVRFEANGLMRVAPEAVTRVDLERHGRQVTLVRGSDGRWQALAAPRTAPAAGPQVEPQPGRDGAGTLSEAVTAKLAMAIRFMHTAAPIRRLEGPNLTPGLSAQFGLADGGLAVRLRTAPADSTPLLAVRFGAHNPEDTAQYMAVDDRDGLYLMSRFVGAEWNGVATAVLPP